MMKLTVFILYSSILVVCSKLDPSSLKNQGYVSSVYDLLDRLFEVDMSSKFNLSFQAGPCGKLEAPCFTIATPGMYNVFKKEKKNYPFMIHMLYISPLI